MITVTYRDTPYVCHKAIKGDNYIHLLDASDGMIAAFDGITDFNLFTITNGEWTTPASDEECYIAIIREDGTVGKGGHKCSDVVPNARYKVTLTAASSNWTLSNGVYTKVLNIEAVQSTDLVIMVPETQRAWAQSYLGIDVADGSITLSTSTLPLSDCVLYLYFVDSSNTIILE